MTYPFANILPSVSFSASDLQHFLGEAHDDSVMVIIIMVRTKDFRRVSSDIEIEKMRDAQMRSECKTCFRHNNDVRGHQQKDLFEKRPTTNENLH
jgi:hypothetical protein